MPTLRFAYSAVDSWVIVMCYYYAVDTWIRFHVVYDRSTAFDIITFIGVVRRWRRENGSRGALISRTRKGEGWRTTAETPQAVYWRARRASEWLSGLYGAVLMMKVESMTPARACSLVVRYRPTSRRPDTRLIETSIVERLGPRRDVMPAAVYRDD